MGEVRREAEEADTKDLHFAPARANMDPTRFQVEAAISLTGFDLDVLEKLFRETADQDNDWRRLTPSGRHKVGKGMPQGSTILHTMAYRPPPNSLECEAYIRLCNRACRCAELVLNTRNGSGKTALMMACSHKNFPMADALCSRGAGASVVYAVP